MIKSAPGVSRKKQIALECLLKTFSVFARSECVCCYLHVGMNGPVIRWSCSEDQRHITMSTSESKATVYACPVWDLWICLPVAQCSCSSSTWDGQPHGTRVTCIYFTRSLAPAAKTWTQLTTKLSERCSRGSAKWKLVTSVKQSSSWSMSAVVSSEAPQMV